MTMTSSQFGLGDMEEALLWAPSYPMADHMGPLLLHPDQEELGGGTSVSEGGVSPASSLSSSLHSSSFSPPTFYSPPPSPPAMLLQGDKTGPEVDLLSLPWLSHPDQLRHPHSGASDEKEDVISSLDWMTERMDLSEFDLDSLIDSCGSGDDSPTSPEDLLASLDCPMELDSLQLDTPLSLSTPSYPSASVVSTSSAVAPPICSPAPSVPTEVSLQPAAEPISLVDEYETLSPPPCVPEPQEELEIKSEPVSPVSSPTPVHSPPSHTYTLDLGSEVDVSECEEVKPVVATVVPPVPRIVLSLSPTRIVLLLAPKDEVGVATTTVTTTPEIIHASPTPSTPSRSPRSRPYPNPKSRSGPASPAATVVKAKSPRVSVGGEKGPSKSPKDKKLKKMEQNKTAATRYRQKKKVEHDQLNTEYCELERRNIELTEKAESMVREIQYLKELMEEVRLARMKKGSGADL